ncbi:MAG: TIGR04283 family arsenosugar biosynthesis glycosyltransferase [Deltaproteobacteria bacterium]|nr:TIGR04283 family arsenosugar biosynthesis glycosyltransferase [Deltaproteobacteria bacterium]
MRLSVIIPTLNEQEVIEAQVRRTASLAGVSEVIVADGGSADATVPRVPRLPEVRVVAAPRGRASQMNAGARAASGDVLLFLHADVRLPDDAARHIEAALVDPHTVGGAFRTWTAPDRPTWLGPLLHLADLRSRYTSLPYGDQAPFVRRAAFDALGGFPEQPLMEDLEFSLRLHRLGAIARVPARVRVSGRRFVVRPLFFTALVNVFPALYRLGVSPASLARWYAHVR